MQLAQKKILLGITGGIAAYKTPDLVRKLTALGAQVRCVMTASAAEFVSPLALQAVSGHPVGDDLLDRNAEAAMGHIELAKWADKVLIAPTTANFMAKLAHGLADDLLSTLCLATSAPIYIAPAMNQQMWHAKATQANLGVLQQRGVTILGPAPGEQACGDVGLGRMLEPVDIANMLAQSSMEPLLANRHIVITAGPTREEIDPVRFISNHSSGKMGYALASAAVALGAKVTLVSGPVNLPCPAGVDLVNVVSAEQMHSAVMKAVGATQSNTASNNVQPNCDIFIGCAAVADYKPQQKTEQKIKKSDTELTLTFTRNPDILSDVAHLAQPPFTVGFAAETQDVAHYAQDKLKRKKLDMIAANDVSQAGLGFNSERNALNVYWNNGGKNLGVADKSQLAISLMTLVAQRHAVK
ncbi:MAG: bifunctional phosphopantothenoylcysteine decarboxylase/phosphopantothenate--cysteine ligase CoaBC [Alteromonadaceae bacterium]|uniref:bifunctional phosphopantothenoylcysteine decarboxylase/phosphopantothenate--cysteine ligase CoaBC n=1 Tax=Paraglaciecola chathamensis TaxID=368405 RepID=UPI000C6A9B73|nr:bifunctional phosphopantothenoylcysteine decarboxylase/phosphopantothenate--cysteine ligase CoaBC [Paraglaciecola agarilytica]MBN23497.1 bifunctional phosphopantothenoylcysteine decarboxylase/phosphopantothenate--cysteine ligase CoaBC [Alteromonadaceae bacterium]|tara:strand:- start:23128 stop:24363 length:1236 start_codon:yes stop_codon:yes gene_type:complete